MTSLRGSMLETKTMKKVVVAREDMLKRFRKKDVNENLSMSNILLLLIETGPKDLRS